jgi:uncharacterized radical SAM superfamily protein
MSPVAYAPGREFPSVSVTGGACALDCAHCSGRYLAGMEPATDAEALWGFARGLAERGGIGLLVSGGCDASGHVPLEPFLATIKRIRGELGLRVNVHVGLCDDLFVKKLANVHPDAVSVDILGSDAAAREVFGLGGGAGAYWETYERLLAAGLNAVPHVTIGLAGDGESGELAAVERLARRAPARLVLNVLVPTKGTRYGDRRVDPDRTLEIVKLARTRLPKTFIVLGCMRPRGWAGFEASAAGVGVDGIVNPSRAAVDAWKSSGKRVEKRKTCCALVE